MPRRRRGVAPITGTLIPSNLQRRVGDAGPGLTSGSASSSLAAAWPGCRRARRPRPCRRSSSSRRAPGGDTSVLRLDPNVTVATTTVTARMAPRMAERTGTAPAARPRLQREAHAGDRGRREPGPVAAVVTRDGVRGPLARGPAPGSERDGASTAMALERRPGGRPRRIRSPSSPRAPRRAGRAAPARAAPAGTAQRRPLRPGPSRRARRRACRRGRRRGHGAVGPEGADDVEVGGPAGGCGG